MAAFAVDGVRFLPASDQSLMVYFGSRITPQAHELVVRFLRLLQLQPIEGIRNLHPAYCSVLVKFDAMRWTHDELEALLRELLATARKCDPCGPRVRWRFRFVTGESLARTWLRFARFTD